MSDREGLLYFRGPVEREREGEGGCGRGGGGGEGGEGVGREERGRGRHASSAFRNHILPFILYSRAYIDHVLQFIQQKSLDQIL